MLTVVAPAYNEGEVLPVFLSRLTAVLASLDEEWEIVIVDDGSRDSTWSVLEEAAAERPPNPRHPFVTELRAPACLDGRTDRRAWRRSRDHGCGRLLAARPGNDVVYAVRSMEDAAGFWKRFSARLFYGLLRRLSSLDLPDGAADYRWMSRRVVDVLVSMPERHRFLRGLVRWAGYNKAFVQYSRGAREAGASKYGPRRMVLLAWDAVVSFSSLPLRAAGAIGVIVSLLGWLYLVYVLVIGLFTNHAVQGWASVTAAVLLLGGVQLIFLGILGQYIGRMYDDVKRRPLFLIAEDTAGHEAATR